MGQSADPVPDVATQATRVPTGGADAKQAPPDRILGPPWRLSTAGGMVAQSL